MLCTACVPNCRNPAARPQPGLQAGQGQKHVTYTDEVEQYKKPREGYVVKSYLQKFVGSNLVDEVD